MDLADSGRELGTGDDAVAIGVVRTEQNISSMSTYFVLLLLNLVKAFAQQKLRDHDIQAIKAFLSGASDYKSFQSWSQEYLLRLPGCFDDDRLDIAQKDLSSGARPKDLLAMLAKLLPWLRAKSPKKVLGDFGNTLHGSYRVDCTDGSFVHATMTNGTFQGPFVTFNSADNYLTVTMMKNNKFENHLFRQWRSQFWTTSYSNASQSGFICPLKAGLDCPCVHSDQDLRFRYTSLEGVTSAETFAVPVFSVSTDEVDIPVPEHLRMAESPEKDAILHAVYSVSCGNRHRQPAESMVANQTLFDKHFYMSGKTSFFNHSYWANTLQDDPNCSHFSEVFWPPIGSVHRTILACFPGSGSKWLMEMLQFTSGMAMSHINVPQLMIKDHHDDPKQIVSILQRNIVVRRPILTTRLQSLIAARGRGVLLIRNPFEAILSWWNHIRSQSVREGGLKPDELKITVQGEPFCRFAVAEAEMWRLLYLDWLTMVKDVIVVHYERVKEDAEREVKRVLHYARVPIDEDRLDCLRKHPFDPYKRPKVDLGLNPFCSRARERITAAMDEVNLVLLAKGHEPLPTDMYKYQKFS